MGPLLPLVIAWLLGVAMLALVGVQRSVPLERLFLDPAHLNGAPWYTGVISSLGVLLWTVGAVTAAFGAWVAAQTGRPSATRFLAAGSAVGTVLLLDDLLQLHARLIPEVLGVGKAPAMLLVTAPTLVWAVVWRDELARTRWMMLAGFVASSAVSVGVDHALSPTGATTLLVEDGAKILGILAWAMYFTTTTLDITRSTIRAVTRDASIAGHQTEPLDNG